MSDHDEHGGEPCLTCAIRGAVFEHFRQVSGAQKPGDRIVIDAGDVITACAELMADVVHGAPSRAVKRQLQEFADEALAAAHRYKETGVVQAITMPEARAEH